MAISAPAAWRRVTGGGVALDVRTVVIGLAVLVVAYLTLLPIVMLVWGSLKTTPPGVVSPLTLDNYVRAYTDPETYRLLNNTFVYAAGTALLSLALGTTLAWIVERTNTPFKPLFFLFSLVPLIIPGIMHTVSWMLLLSPRIGVINRLLMDGLGLQQPPFDIYSMGGMIWIEALHLSPLVFVLMSAAFKSMDPAMEEASVMSGAGGLVTLRRVTLRLVLPAMASAGLIMFVRGLESFEVPAMVGIPAKIQVYTSQIFMATHKYPVDYGLAGAFAFSLLVLSGLGVFWYHRLTARRESFATVTGKAYRPRLNDLGPWRWLAAAFCLLYFMLAAIGPIFVLVWSSLLPYYAVPSAAALQNITLANYAAVLQYPDVLQAFGNSLTLSAGSATVVMLLTAVISWIVVKTRTPGRQALDLLAFLPIAVPGIVVGTSLMWFYLSVPLPLYGTIWILLIAYVTKFMPYGMRASTSSMVQIHNELEEAANISGANWLQVFVRVYLPLLRPGLLAGWIYVAIVGLREFSSSIMLYSSESVVASILVWELWVNGQYSQVATIGVLMITVLAVMVGVMTKVAGRYGVKA